MSSSNNSSHDANYARQDYEGLQPVDSPDPSSGLQPVTTTPPYQDHHIKYQQYFYQSPQQHGETTTGTEEISNTVTIEEKKSRRILGMRRTTFWLTASNIILAIALVLVGVLPAQLGKNNNGMTNDTSGNNSNATCSPSNNTPETPTPPICFSTTIKTPSGTPPGTPRPECPLQLSSASDQTYTVPRTNLTFSRLCNTDYPGGDMAQFPVSTMQDCLALCAQLNLFPSSIAGPCVGVTWVYDDDGGPQGQGISYCFPKNFTGKGVTRAGTESAFLV